MQDTPGSRPALAKGRFILQSGTALGVILGLQHVAPARAQGVPPASDTPAPYAAHKKSSGSRQIEEVTVTARRKTEKLSNVPVSVSALSAASLVERHVTTEQDLESVVPGLTVYGVNSSNSLNFSLRGQSVDAFSFAAPAVLTYVNEFSVLSDSASSFYDTQSIQVLKGPQGTLFGRNATGGGILYQTTPPKPTLGGYLTVGYGNYNDRTVEGALNIPLGPQLGELRISGDYEQRDGFQHNLLLNIMNGSLDNAGGRISWRYHPIEGLESLTVVQLQNSGGNSIGLKASSVYLPGQTNNGTPVTAALPAGAVYVPGVEVQNPAVAAFGFNGIVDFLNKQKQYGFYDNFDAQNNKHNGFDALYTNNSSYHFSDAFTLKNVVGYHRSYSHDNTDIDGEPYQPLTIGVQDGAAANGYRYHDTQLSEELQASGKLLNGALTYLGGGYYFRGHSQTLEQLNIFGDLVDPTTGLPIPPAADFLRSFIYDTYSYAAYAQGTYSITPQLHATGGIRYTSEKDTYTPGGGDEEAAIGVKPSGIVNAKPSWTDSIDYKVTPSLLVYVANRGSWRAGGFNGTSQNFLPDGQAVAQSFLPETTYDVEVGAKYSGQLGGIPTTLNVALYNQWVQNVIRAIYFNDSANSGNVKAAEVKGLEFDGTVQPVDWLQLGLTTAFTDAAYTSPDAMIGNRSFVFGPYGDTPRWNGSAFARFSWALPDTSEFVFRADYYGQTSFYFSNAAATILPDTHIGGYSLANLRVELNNIRGSSVSAAAFVRNLTGTQYYTGGFALGAVTGINSELVGLPRMFGFQLSTKF